MCIRDSLNSIHTAIEYFDIEKEKTGRINYHLFLDSTVHDDLITMLRTFYEEQLKEILRILQRLANNPNKQMIEKACAIIYHQYAESSFSLNAVADEINISYGYLCTIFKQVTGEKFMDYLLRVRMQNAKRLLLEGGHKIYEIAQQTGYNSARYFTLTFRKYYGMTPSAVSYTHLDVYKRQQVDIIFPAVRTQEELRELTNFAGGNNRI